VRTVGPRRTPGRTARMRSALCAPPRPPAVARACEVRREVVRSPRTDRSRGALFAAVAVRCRRLVAVPPARGAVPDRHRETKSKYTAGRNIPGTFEGETVTRRRLMNLWANGVGAVATAAFALPALGFAIAPIFKRQSWQWQPIGRPSDFPKDAYMTKVIPTAEGIGEAGNTIAYVRARNPSIDKEPEDQYNRFVALSSRCMHL